MLHSNPGEVNEYLAGLFLKNASFAGNDFHGFKCPAILLHFVEFRDAFTFPLHQNLLLAMKAMSSNSKKLTQRTPTTISGTTGLITEVAAAAAVVVAAAAAIVAATVAAIVAAIVAAEVAAIVAAIVAVEVEAIVITALPGAAAVEVEAIVITALPVAVAAIRDGEERDGELLTRLRRKDRNCLMTSSRKIP